MLDIQTIKQYADDWAYDMDIKTLSRGELTNVDVINQSIEMILATPRATRLFNLSFGSDFSYRIFDNMNEYYLEKVIDDTVNAIERWEDRIIVLDQEVSLDVDPDRNTFKITIPYIVKERNIKAEFTKIIKQ